MDALTPVAARKFIRAALKTGSLVLGNHAEERMKERDMTSADITSVLRGGVCAPVETSDRGAPRYRIETQRMSVVVELDEPDEIYVVTCMRHT